jgi:hypothetical protein
MYEILSLLKRIYFNAETMFLMSGVVIYNVETR